MVIGVPVAVETVVEHGAGTPAHDAVPLDAAIVPLVAPVAVEADDVALVLPHATSSAGAATRNGSAFKRLRRLAPAFTSFPRFCCVVLMFVCHGKPESAALVPPSDQGPLHVLAFNLSCASSDRMGSASHRIRPTRLRDNRSASCRLSISASRLHPIRTRSIRLAAPPSVSQAPTGRGPEARSRADPNVRAKLFQPCLDAVKVARTGPTRAEQVCILEVWWPSLSGLSNW